MNKKAFTSMENYEAPRVEVVEVERGFAQSITGSDPDSDDPEP